MQNVTVRRRGEEVRFLLSILLAERSSFSDDEDVPNVIFQLHLALQFSSSVPSYMALMGGSIFQHKKRNEAGRVNRLKSSLSDLNESFFSLCSREFSGFSGAGSWYLFKTEIYRYCL